MSQVIKHLQTMTPDCKFTQQHDTINIIFSIGYLILHEDGGKKKQRTADVLSDLSISKQRTRTPHSHSNTTKKPPLDRLLPTNK